jgi:multidrug efflux pump subunit AcrA (membrane-fusion protein)
LIDYGQPVTAGQPVAILRRQSIQAELDAAKGDLAVRVAELEELEKSLPDEIEQARAKLDEAQSLLDYRRIRAERSKALGAKEVKEIVEEDAALATQAAAALRNAQAALRMLTAGPRDQKTLQAKARVDVQAAQVQRLTEEFDRHTMLAPFDGFVSAEHTEVGQWLKQGDPVAEIVELKSVDIEIAVLEDYVSGLDTTVVGQVEVSALPGQTFPGQVAMISPQADARARTFPVRVRVKDAVVLGGQSPIVYVAAGTPTKSAVKPVPVKLGLATGAWIAVSGEIQPGELVIVEGNERVRPGMEIRTEPKKMEQP